MFLTIIYEYWQNGRERVRAGVGLGTIEMYEWDRMDELYKWGGAGKNARDDSFLSP